MIEHSRFQLLVIILAWNLICIVGDRQLLQYVLEKFEGEDYGQSIRSQTGDELFTLETIQQVSDGPGVVPIPACKGLQTLNLPQFTLSQSDFDSGTKIISEPGVYTFTSDVIFNPNSAEALGVEPYFAGDVQPQQFKFYDPEAYGIGFFAAISITTNNVTIDLNGFTLEQGKEHALNQRFYFHIELAAAPFVGGQGPHFFGKPIFTANNVCIKNGVMGRTAHAAVHGNNNTNIEVRDLIIQDFEVGVVQFNFGRDIVIENIHAPFTRTDVPIRGRFSAARFIRPWINKLVDSGYTGTLNVGGKKLSALDVQTALRKALNKATTQVLRFGKVKGDLVPLFGNPSGLPDGSLIFGVNINFLGVAVNGLPQNVPLTARSQRIQIRNFRITTMELNVLENPALTVLPPDTPDRSKRQPATDAVGAVLETQDGFTVTSKGVYLGNPVANAQLLVAKAQSDNFEFNFGPERKQIGPEIVEWAESGRPYTDFGLTYMCNGDIMFHVNKGAIAFKLDAANNVTCEKCVVEYIRNDGDIGSTLCNDDIPYKKGVGKSSPLATQPGYNGGDSRGFSLSSSSNVLLDKCAAKYVLARAGDAIGFDVVFGSEKIKIRDAFVKKTQAGYGYFPFQYVHNPTRKPKSKKFNKDDSVSDILIHK